MRCFCQASIVVCVVALTSAWMAAAPARAQTSGDASESESSEEGMSVEEIARMMDNPLGNLWIIFTENDLTRYRGDPAPGSKWINTLLIQPIIPLPLTKNWNLVTRPIIPLVSAPLLRLNPPTFGD